MGSWYWVLSENRKNKFPARKNQSVSIAKISFRKTQKIANPQKFRATRCILAWLFFLFLIFFIMLYVISASPF